MSLSVSSAKLNPVVCFHVPFFFFETTQLLSTQEMDTRGWKKRAVSCFLTQTPFYSRGLSSTRCELQNMWTRSTCTIWSISKQVTHFFFFYSLNWCVTSYILYRWSCRSRTRSWSVALLMIKLLYLIIVTKWKLLLYINKVSNLYFYKTYKHCEDFCSSDVSY